MNILDDFEAYERYKNDIPVILLDGRELARHRLTESQLTDALAGASGERGGGGNDRRA